MSDSEPSTPVTNPNVAYVNQWYWVFYVFLLAGSFYFGVFFNISQPTLWTSIIVVHSVINYVCFHWIKGSPMGDDYFKPRGAYDKQTFWEQIDNGAQFTPTKKFLIMVPIVLLLVSTYTAKDYFFVNFFCSFWVIISKLPAFHKVRLFGINK